MKRIILGEKTNAKYGFRETCFGIVVNKGKILFVKKDNQFSLVGGGIDNGEPHEECLRREFLEETGYTITSYEELVCVDYFWLAGNKWPLESLANIYLVKVDKQTKVEPQEVGHSIEYIDLNKVEQKLPLPYHKFAINYYIKNKIKM